MLLPCLAKRLLSERLELKFELLPLVVVDADAQTSQTASMDGKYTIFLNRQRKKADGSTVYHRSAYAYNNAGVYTVLLNESNEDVAATADLVNPLDTFSRKHKYAGDYIKDKRNMIAVRDGKDARTMRFYVHFEKDNNTCRGEVRGEAKEQWPECHWPPRL